MKIFINICIFLLALPFLWKANAQVVITGNCTGVTVSASSLPQHANNLFEFPIEQSGCLLTKIPPTAMTRRTQLQRFNHTTQSFEAVGGFVHPPNGINFNNLAHGTYRVKVQVPIIMSQPNCVGGFAKVNNSSGQHIGFRGHYTEGPTGTFFSNEVIVGMTTPSDINFTFIDVPETGSESAYDYGEPVKINTSQCKNYDRWMIAIIEDGGANRYMSTGWMNGKIGGGDGSMFDLTNLWKGWITHWEFETFRSYHVQVVLENNNCPNPSWNQLIRTFFVCPTGTGCRLGEREEQPIHLGPNPANSSVFLHNFDAGSHPGSLIVISDMTGRTQQTGILTDNEIDLSALPVGIYALQLIHKGQRLFTSKLIIAR